MKRSSTAIFLAGLFLAALFALLAPTVAVAKPSDGIICQGVWSNGEFFQVAQDQNYNFHLTLNYTSTNGWLRVGPDISGADWLGRGNTPISATLEGSSVVSPEQYLTIVPLPFGTPSLPPSRSLMLSGTIVSGYHVTTSWLIKQSDWASSAASLNVAGTMLSRAANCQVSRRPSQLTLSSNTPTTNHLAQGQIVETYISATLYTTGELKISLAPFNLVSSTIPYTASGLPGTYATYGLLPPGSYNITNTMVYSDVAPCDIPPATTAMVFTTGRFDTGDGLTWQPSSCYSLAIDPPLTITVKPNELFTYSLRLTNTGEISGAIALDWSGEPLAWVKSFHTEQDTPHFSPGSIWMDVFTFQAPAITGTHALTNVRWLDGHLESVVTTTLTIVVANPRPTVVVFLPFVVKNGGSSILRAYTPCANDLLGSLNEILGFCQRH